jgi:hypothetical protein
MNWQMGNRALGIRHQFWKAQHNKFTDPDRFHDRMDGASVSSKHHARIPLVSVLWRSLGQHQSWSSGSLDLTLWNKVTLHSQTPVLRWNRQMHQQHRKVRSYPIGPPKTKSHWRANLRFQSGVRIDRERVHSKGADIREIPSSSSKDVELLKGFHSGIHWAQQKCQSWWSGESSSLQHSDADRCIFSGARRRLGQNSPARAQNHKYHRRRRLESSDNGIPPPLIWARQ